MIFFLYLFHSIVVGGGGSWTHLGNQFCSLFAPIFSTVLILGYFLASAAACGGWPPRLGYKIIWQH